jgi:hypothetical protein
VAPTPRSAGRAKINRTMAESVAAIIATGQALIEARNDPKMKHGD